MSEPVPAATGLAVPAGPVGSTALEPDRDRGS
jgi:hypothetical protein